jgi:hypothetical protein
MAVFLLKINVRSVVNEMKIGDIFNPYKLFVGLFIPRALARYKGLSQGAKMCYGALSLFAGEDGQAWPSMETLGVELGVSRRQAVSYVKELKEQNFIKTVATGKSNKYIFLWHEVLDQSMRREAYFPADGNNTSQHDGNNTSHKENHLKESSKKNKESTTQPQKAPALALDNSSSKDQPQSEMNQAIGYYLELFEAATGEKAIITKGKDHQLIKTILTTYGIEKTLALLDAYFETADNFVIERGYPLGIFRSNLTGLLVKYKEQQKIKKKEEAQKEEQRRRQELESLKEEQFEKARAEWEALPEVEKVRSKLKEKREFIYGPMREHFNKYAEQGDEEALARLQKYARQEGELIKQLRAAGGIEADKLWNELKKEEERIASYYRSNGLRMIES